MMKIGGAVYLKETNDNKFLEYTVKGIKDKWVASHKINGTQSSIMVENKVISEDHLKTINLQQSLTLTLTMLFLE